MPAIEARKLCKSFGKLDALRELSFRVEEGEYAVVLGPSGCGKTTLLRIIAGLVKPDSGSVLVGGADITATPPEERGIGFFFQNYALFPHLSVYDNVAYGLRMRGLAEDEIGRRVKEKLRMVGLLDWAGHLPRQLSGGMQQRVALARALSIESKLVLLDEPLNALDAKIGAILRMELVRMAKEMGLTVIHVTPNQEEAMEVADKVIVIKEGRVEQVGKDYETYNTPATPFVAYFLGETNFLKVRRAGPKAAQYGKDVFQTPCHLKDEEAVIAIKSEKVLFERREKNTLEGVIENVNFLGKTTRYEVRVPGGGMVFVETAKHPDLKACDRVYVHMPPGDMVVFSGKQMFDESINVIEYAEY